jgi:hypothetical protein
MEGLISDYASFDMEEALEDFTTSSVKAPKNFEPNHAMLIMHHTTLPRCGCIGTLQGLYKGSQ